MILAAGKSTRLGALGQALPKPIVPVCGTPAIAFGLSACARAGVTEVVVNLHHQGARIVEAVGNGQLYGVNSDDALAQAMQRVGLDDKLERRVGQYSQGMRQRLSLARAIFHGPRLLLLDEPFSNVDPDSALQIAKLLADMRSGGTTILLVTHQIGLLANLADEYLMLPHGQLVDRGPMTQDRMKQDPTAKGTA